PNEALRDRIDAGWGKTVPNRDDVVALAFSTEDSRVVDRGCITYAPRDGGAQRYYCDALLAYPGQRITIRVPAYDPQYLFCFAPDGSPIGIARPERTFHPLDPAGAVEGGARNKMLRREISQKAKHVVLLDLVAETKRHVQHMPDAPEAPVAAVVSVEMLDRMAALEAEERARLAAPDTEPRRAPNQWDTGTNAALAALEFEDEET
ncbi:MAG: Mu transposase C-terminal domain-containing protein, partial [Paracoccus sp. (in: a-proteobacteria)]|nr:Mu transposase C-terminal domain-containing protein [Paracoccus sp. (in: a-proteobacteria)]